MGIEDRVSEAKKAKEFDDTLSAVKQGHIQELEEVKNQIVEPQRRARKEIARLESAVQELQNENLFEKWNNVSKFIYTHKDLIF